MVDRPIGPAALVARHGWRGGALVLVAIQRPRHYEEDYSRPPLSTSDIQAWLRSCAWSLIPRTSRPIQGGC